MVRWGILGAGNIAHRFSNCIVRMQDSKLLAIACRTLEKTEEFAVWFQTVEPNANLRQYDSYDELLKDEEIDAIYLSLPHGLHKDWAIQALLKNKAVLCEKPATLNAGEMLLVASVAKEQKTLFMEAMKTRFVPAYRKMSELIKRGAIGEILRVDTSLCNEMPDAGKTYHYQAGQGGALLDVGIYAASWLEDWMPGEISVVNTEVTIKNGVDYYINANILIGGKEASIECAFDRKKPRVAIITGTEGKLVIPELHRPDKIILYHNGNEAEEFRFPYEVDDFYSQIVHFEDCYKKHLLESQVMPLEASARCAKILDEIRNHYEGMDSHE